MDLSIFLLHWGRFITYIWNVNIQLRLRFAMPAVVYICFSLCAHALCHLKKTVDMHTSCIKVIDCVRLIATRKRSQELWPINPGNRAKAKTHLNDWIFYIKLHLKLRTSHTFYRAIMDNNVGPFRKRHYNECK